MKTGLMKWIQSKFVTISRLDPVGEFSRQLRFNKAGDQLMGWLRCSPQAKSA